LENPVKNLYFKPWILTKEQIEERLTDIDFTWKWCGRQVFFFVNPETQHDVHTKIEGLNRENGSILFDSVIDYVFSSSEEFEQQIRDTWGEGTPIILTYPKEGNKEKNRSDSFGNDG
jgi:hypothetical protein